MASPRNRADRRRTNRLIARRRARLAHRDTNADRVPRPAGCWVKRHPLPCGCSKRQRGRPAVGVGACGLDRRYIRRMRRGERLLDRALRGGDGLGADADHVALLCSRRTELP